MEPEPEEGRMAVNERLREQAQTVIYEALEIETGGLGPNPNRENSGEYLTRCAVAVARHLDLAELLVEPAREQPKPKPIKQQRAKKASKRG